MPHIEWNDEFSVKIDEIDAQHKKWIRIINELHDTLVSNASAADLKNATINSLDSMRDYASLHFTFEENYMDSIGYPDIYGHKQIHNNLLRQVDMYRNDIATGKTVLNTSIMKTLMNWLTDHILNEDRKYRLHAENSQSID